jgi:hypothetical protein
MTHAVRAREAFNNHKALMAAVICSKTDMTRAMTVSIPE